MGEGADILMVKPTMPYLDVLADMAQLAPDHPLACYQVSGEFAMIHAGARAGVYDLRTMAFESVNGALRAGACSCSLGRRARANGRGQVRRWCSRTLRPSSSSGYRRRHSSKNMCMSCMLPSVQKTCVQCLTACDHDAAAANRARWICISTYSPCCPRLVLCLHAPATMSLPPIRRQNEEDEVEENEPLLGAPGANEQPVESTLGRNLFSGTAPLAQIGALILALAVYYSIGTHPIALFSAHPVRGLGFARWPALTMGVPGRF
jgi:hypothetical protein